MTDDGAWLDPPSEKSFDDQEADLRAELYAIDMGKHELTNEQVRARCREIAVRQKELERKREQADSFDNVGTADVDLKLESLPANIMELELPPPEYAWQLYFPLREVTAFVGEGNAGKSFFVLTAMLHIAAGLDFCGQPTKPGRVVYVTAEDPKQKVMRRVQTILWRMPAESRAKALQNFRVMDVVSLGLRLVDVERGSVRVTTVADQIANRCGNAVVVALDTLSRLNGASENDNAAMATIVVAGERIAKQTGACVPILHHTGQSAAREGIADMYSGRGATAFGDCSRSFVRLQPVTAKMSQGLQISTIDLEAGRIVRVLHVRNSDGPSAEPVWLRRDPLNGYLAQIFPLPIDPVERDESWMDRLVLWASADDREPFTQSDVAKNREAIFGDRISKNKAEELFNEAKELGHLIDSNVRSRGGKGAAWKQIVNPATAEAVLQETAKLQEQFEVETEQ